MSSDLSRARLDPADMLLMKSLQKGLSLESRPYDRLAQETGLSEHDVIQKLSDWQKSGLLKRLGIIVRHRELGYQANAMVVFDIPDDDVRYYANAILKHSFVTLCYRRPRHQPVWPFNLFCMIHGKDRVTVEAKVEQLRQRAGLMSFQHAVLFSTHCYKQRGARYAMSQSHSNECPKDA